MLEQKFDQAPWTIRQTFLGILLTLLPWIALSIGLSSLSSSNPIHPVKLSPQSDLINAIINYLLSALIEGAFLIAPFYFARKAARRSEVPGLSTWQLLGFRRFHWIKALTLIILLFITILFLNVVYQDLINVLHLHLQTNDQVILQRSKLEPLTTYSTLLASVIIAPFCEEVFFRSFVFMGLWRGMPLVGAMIFSALIFAVAHADPASFLVLFFIGLMLAFVRWRTRSIWPGMLLHALNNGIGAALIVLAMNGH